MRLFRLYVVTKLIVVVPAKYSSSVDQQIWQSRQFAIIDWLNARTHYIGSWTTLITKASRFRTVLEAEAIALQPRVPSFATTR